MKYELKNRWTGELIYSTEADSWAQVIKAAREKGADLRSANLGGANLGGADLGGANLGGANLGGADLRSANLYGANLYGADLGGANLYGANLGGADMGGANLYGADLRSANLPSPQVVLSALWGSLSEQLTADLMEYDANSHPDRALFVVWAAGGKCPYDGGKFQRAANFKEVRELWGKGVVDTPYNLMVRVLKEKTKQE